MKCCGYDMMERKDYNGVPIWWCSSCGKKRVRAIAEICEDTDKEVS